MMQMLWPEGCHWNHCNPKQEITGSTAMSAAFIPTRMRISTDRYQNMVTAGVLSQYDRVELIEGEMLDRGPISAKHAAATARLARLFILAAGDLAVISPGGPVNLGDYSEPQPDVLLLKPRADYYGFKIPEAADVLLLIEYPTARSPSTKASSWVSTLAMVLLSIG
jgi:hypothetical protein